MSCPHCGAETQAGSAFCYACRRRLDAPVARLAGSAGPSEAAAPALAHARPGAITVIAVLDLAGGFCGLIVTALLAWAAHANAPSRLAFGIGAACVGLMALLYLLCGAMLLALHPIARVLQIALAILSICNPISILPLVYLLRPGVRLLFSGRRPPEMSSPERQLIERDGRVAGSSVVILGVVFAVVMLGLVPMMGIVAAIAIPALLRARIAANESAAIGDTRTLISAQLTYASANGGLYEGRLECLSAPQTCLPGSSAESAPASFASLAQRVKQGYERRLVAGAAPDPQVFDVRRQSASSVTSYVYVSVPVASGQTGVRGICGDHTGRVCSTRSPELLRNLDGSGCPEEPECTSFLTGSR